MGVYGGVKLGESRGGKDIAENICGHLIFMGGGLLSSRWRMEAREFK